MKKIFLVALLPALLLGACTGKKTDRAAAQKVYKESLKDSIEVIEHQIDSCKLAMVDMTEFVDNTLNKFTVVENPREVEGYYILKDWAGKYPLQSTGLVARITKSEQLELIASLKGGTFDQIQVVSGVESMESDVVPNDQALNYRRDGLTTVMFSGAKADEIGSFIADNELNNLKLVFLENGKVRSSWVMPVETAKMATITWALSNGMKNLNKTEMNMKVLSQKVYILRKHIE